MEKKFDLVVIGTRAAGSAAAYKCRKAGWDVAIIDSRPFGYLCAPRLRSKESVGAAELIDWTGRMVGKGFRQKAVR
jgi:glutathione reductase (NADPH)